MPRHDAIFLENRRTPRIVAKGESYTPTDAEGRIVKRRALSREEEDIIRDGSWLRVDVKGRKPGDPGYLTTPSKIRPQFNEKAKKK